MRLTAFCLAAAVAFPAMAEEVNVYSYRQPDLIDPLAEAFTACSGGTCTIDVHLATSGYDPTTTGGGLGSTIASAAPLLTIADMAHRSTVVTSFGTTAIAQGDALFFWIDSNAGSADDLVVMITIEKYD